MRGRDGQGLNDELNEAGMAAGERTVGERQEGRLTLSEEELAIGKRQVLAGEVALRKTVETERVRENVPVMREEVSIERHPVTDARLAAGAEIGEAEIRVPVMQEEVVAEKRGVAKEEVVVRKHAVEETQQVEADLRRERLSVDERDLRGTRGRAEPGR